MIGGRLSVGSQLTLRRMGSFPAFLPIVCQSVVSLCELLVLYDFGFPSKSRLLVMSPILHFTLL